YPHPRKRHHPTDLRARTNEHRDNGLQGRLPPRVPAPAPAGLPGPGTGQRLLPVEPATHGLPAAGPRRAVPAARPVRGPAAVPAAGRVPAAGVLSAAVPAAVSAAL